MDFLLRLKPWQLFLIVFILPILCPSTGFFKIISIGAIVTYVGWIYAVGVKMNSLIDIEKQPNALYFNISCAFLAVTLLILSFTGGYSINQDNYKDYGNSVFFLGPLTLYIIWSFIYIMLFAARALQSVKNGYLTYRSDSLPQFFLFWFYPVGIWIIQPEVQELIITDDAV